MAKCKRCEKSGMLLKVNNDGLCMECLSAEVKESEIKIKELQEKLTPEVIELSKNQDYIKGLEDEKKKISDELIDRRATIRSLDSEINSRRQEIVQLDIEILVQEFGLYKPQFDFANSDLYKERLDRNRQQQKGLIINHGAVTGAMTWSVNGDEKKGKKMVSDMQKLLLRAFNSDCDELVSKVKYNNFEAYKKKMQQSCNAISKLGTIMNVSITPTYLELKIQELTLAYEYARKKQQEKEEQKALREQMREEAKLQKEIEEERKKLEKEQTHYFNALSKLNAQLSIDPQNEDLLQKKQELEAKTAEIEKSIQDVDYREANKRAGYVYVISNIGAFGENVYKIGMTRRLDPQERVDELGDASVPFNFDVHAMIFTEDAPALEAALHRAFEDKKLNMVNHRREFFNVTLDEIKVVVKANYDKTVEFIDVPDAEQYRISQKMKSELVI